MSAGKLPEGWVETNLQNVASWGSGGTPSRNHDEYYNGNIPWIKTGDLGPKIITNASEYITDAGVQNSSAKFFPKGSVAIAMYGATIGKTSILGIDATTNQACAVGTPLEGITSTLFLYYFLLNEKNAFIKKGKGGAQPNISQTVIKEHIVYLPPLAEQKIITEKLDTLLAQVDSTKARLEQIPHILKRFRQAVLSAAVTGKLTERWRSEKGIPFNSWEVKKASDICIKVQSGSTPTGNPFAQNGTIPFLKVYNIVNQKIDFDYKPQYITDEVHRSKSKRSIAFPDDVLMNIVGPPLGKVAILTEQYSEWNINQAITLFRVDKERLLSKFLYHVLCEGSLVRDVIHDTKGIVGQINISLTQCREALIPCPSLEEQHEIVRRVEQLFAYADTIEKQVNNALARVNKLTQSILAKAFRGELTAQWRDENPELISGENSAAALLEKIKAERAASGGKKASRKKS
ncbi:restriction endonuclease subunit S [Escherichia fergusonii]|uniref:Restriction endonuclease subunit S n=1 Tax=Escherichia fergusonii TaxID=564 RepID=A0A7W3I044_ESCFE|nr:restriction endonuclease subunit S [Escherichia fergusonii]EHG6164993.1 restriction endonuclease subunit S [Escherichia fergusonii]EHG7565267.1 restriction endonuclease subunit S [Escherichia fergusonii]MBA8234369.1 restriction endonuclease subunit S [Escherichia fergusonii]MBA8241988.1 restriction endonuclease subunit S [Escherichia fergusonii]QLM09599.1 restriction endonuclease subunit S [Escherichia fergusonii]